MESLGEALPKEQARVRDLIKTYRDPDLKGAGEFAAMMMEQSLKRADSAIIRGDIVEMMRCYEDLAGYSE